MKKILILIIIIFITGCSSYNELNDLGIINTIGITKENNIYKLYISIVINTDETIEPNTNIYEINGNNLYEIINNLNTIINKKIYISHLDLLILDESIKTNEYKEIINFFLNNNTTREDFLVISTSNIKEILDNTKFKEINDLIKINQEESSKSIYTTMYDIINNCYQDKPIYLTKIDYNNYNNYLEIIGINEFKNNNYNFYNQEEIIFINYLINNINKYYYNYKCLNNKYLYLNILKSNTKELNNKLIITNEIKVVINDCNYNKEEINKILNNYLINIKNYTNKEIIIKNTIRGEYENK